MEYSNSLGNLIRGSSLFSNNILIAFYTIALLIYLVILELIFYRSLSNNKVTSLFTYLTSLERSYLVILKLSFILILVN